MNDTFRKCLRFTVLGFLGSVSLFATPVLGSYYAGYYTLTNLGSVPGATNLYGGLTFLAGDPNTLLVGTHANYGDAAVDQVGVTRDSSGHITGFSGSASPVATAPNIDSGLEYGPGGVLFFTEYYTNQVGEIKTGSVAPDKTIALSTGGSVGGLQFVPAGFAGAGNMVLIDYRTGEFSMVPLIPDGSGTYDMGAVLGSVTLPNGPEGVLYVPAGSSRFTNPSVLVAEYKAGDIVSYELDANGLPVLATRKVFLSGLDVTVGTDGGPEGAKVDPLTNDFLFSTYDGSQILRLTANPVPEPGTLSLASLALALGGMSLSRRKRA